MREVEKIKSSPFSFAVDLDGAGPRLRFGARLRQGARERAQGRAGVETGVSLIKFGSLDIKTSDIKAICI